MSDKGELHFNPQSPAYLHLRDTVAKRTRPVIVWLGSGLSLSGGAPSWLGLRRALAEAGTEKFSAQPAGAAARSVDFAGNDENLWRSFETLRDSLGATTYRETIKHAFADTARAAIPIAYNKVWQLDPRGVVTFNLDQFATRAFGAVYDERLFEVSGWGVKKLAAIDYDRKFIANLHGTIDDEESWVFTQQELRRLTADEVYRESIRSILSNSASVFIGMSVDDIAISGHLDALKKNGMKPAAAFWLTNRDDPEMDEWAEDRGIQIVHYESEPSHAGLHEILDRLISYVSPEGLDEKPISGRALVEGAVPVQPGDALGELRMRLNDEASKALAESDAAYEQFLRENAFEIHNAWFISTDHSVNLLFSYKLLDRVAKGGFGGVYRAIDVRTNEQVAVKVLLDEVRREPGMLQSFRRGVRTMEILSSRGLEGMVGLREAAEIPAFICMDWIEGPNLEQAREQGVISDWDATLCVALQIVSIVLEAHRLPEGVLHRDLRPANVMLRDYWATGELDVVVLDFDLSWHKGSLGASINLKSANGYLAPEQLTSRPKESSRHAAVDSFGLAMTLYFLAGGTAPFPSQQLFGSWESDIRKATARLGSSSWRSTPRRYARLIKDASADAQRSRPSLASMQSELSRLRRAELGDGTDRLEHFLEEVMARASRTSNYIFDEGNEAFVARTPTGLSAELAGGQLSNEATLRLSWIATGVEQYRNLGKYMKERKDSASSALMRHGWTLRKSNYTMQDVEIVAVREWGASDDPAKWAGGLESVLESLSFDGR